MNNSHFPQTGLLAFVVLALASSVSLAAPQDGIFSRASDKEAKAADTTAEASTPKSDTSAESQTAAATAVVKESSAQIDQQSDGWFTVVDDTSMVEVRLPGNPKYKEITFSPIVGRAAVVNHLYNSVVNKQTTVDYSWMDLHDAPVGNKQMKEALDGAVKGAVVNVFGELTRMDAIKSGKVQGREFDFNFRWNAPNGKSIMLSGRSRIFIKDNRRYQLNVIGPKGKMDDDMVSKLFDSLIIKGET